MSLLNWSGSLSGRQRVAILAVAVLVLSAGCLGLGDSGSDDPELDDNESVDDPGENNDNNGTDDNGTDDNAPYEGADDWQSQYEPFDSAGEVDVDALTNATLAETQALEAYEYVRTTTVWEAAGGQQIQTSFEDRTAIDIAGNEIQYNRNVTQQGSTTSYEGYLSNETLYEYSERYQQQSPNGWVKQNLSGNYDSVFSQFDVVGGLLTGLENGTVSVAGSAELNGQQTTVLQVNVDNSTLGQPAQGSGGEATLLDSRVVLWITDSDRVLRAASYSAFERTSQGTTVESTVANEFNFEYTDVSITIPDEALNGTVFNA